MEKRKVSVKPEIFTRILAVVILCTLPLAQLASAQEMGGDGLDLSGQIDITNGMAEKNATYTMNKLYANGAVPSAGLPGLQSLQGSAQSYYYQPGAGVMQQVPFAQQEPFAPTQQQFTQTQQQPFAQQQFAPTQQQFMQAQPQQFAPQQFMPSNQQSPQACQANKSSSVQQLLPSINTQLVGALGAAMMLNYMSTGGLKNTLNSMPRGWNNRRQTFGSCVGGNLYY